MLNVSHLALTSSKNWSRKSSEYYFIPQNKVTQGVAWTKSLVGMYACNSVGDNSSSASSDEESCSDVSKLDPEICDDLIFLLNRKRVEIMNRYARFVSCLCTSVKTTGVTVEDFRTYLLKLPAFTSNQQDMLLSGVKTEMKKANTINVIFDLIGEEYTSFLNCDIFLSILDKYCSGMDNNELKYPEYLRAHIDQHKINEFVSVNPELAKITEGDKKLKFKFDIEQTSKVAKVVDLKSEIAAILGVTPSALRLLSIGDGCVIAVFLTPAFVADTIFPLTTQQMSSFCSISVMWIECGDNIVKILSNEEGKFTILC